MTQGGGRPPRWAAALLRASLPEGVRGESVRADLEQEFRAVAARRGARRARRWYGWEAIKLSAHFGAQAMRRDAAGGRGEGGGMDQFAQNVRLALRRFRRNPGFTAVAVGTMALGIGATVAIFSVVNTVLLEPLPYRSADRLVAIWEWNLARDNRQNVANPGNFRAWRDRTDAFEAMTAVTLQQAFTVEGVGETFEARGQGAGTEFFDVLGLDAALGRTFAPEARPDGTIEAVVSHEFWQSRLGGDPGVVGRQLSLAGRPAVVVGVLPPAYVVFGEGTELWVKQDLERGDQTDTGRWLMVVGRLAEGAGLEVARAQLEAVSAALGEEFPEFNKGWSVNPVQLKQQVVGEVARPLWVLLGAVGLLLLIACANVANLFLVRATERQREVAVRASLGASRWTLAGQMIVEGLGIAAVGATLGVVVAQVGTRLMATRMPDAFALPRVAGAGVDGRVLVFAVFVTALTGVLFGLVPALQGAGRGPAGTLNAEGRGASQRSGRLRNGLVALEVAVSVLLLAGAALFGRSFLGLLDTDIGIRADHVLAGRVTMSSPRYREDRQAIVRVLDQVVEGIGGSPEVSAAGATTFLPLDGSGAATGFQRGDRPEPEPGTRPSADIRQVVGDYFGAMGIPLLQGRLFDERDVGDAPRVAIVSRALAEAQYPGESPIGKPLVVQWDSDVPWEIIGVVDDVRMASVEETGGAVIYFPFAQSPDFNSLHIVARATGEAGALAALLRRQVQAADPGLPLSRVRTMESIVARSVARPRMTTFLMLVFAGLATVLAAVGLYGVLSYTVSQRVREIGVRMAIGARPGDVVRLVVREGIGMALVGLVVGLAGTWAAGRVVASLLYEVKPSDPVALGAAAALLAAVAVVACALPAWRATRIPAAEALRNE